MQKTIIHIDGDSFFASCQIALDPSLKGKPVVTGHERGIASAMTAEAKKLGIGRGMPIFQIRKLFPQVIIRASDYQVYGVFAQRMYAIVRRYSAHVEEYSIDECFADITGLDLVYKKPYREIGRDIKNELQRELGITFSIGIGPSKSLAKVASKFEKPNGLTEITLQTIPDFLKELWIGKIWGIGPSASRHLQSLGIKTAGDLIEKPRTWVEDNLDRPLMDIWHELQGISVRTVHAEPDDSYGSIQRTRTFSPASKDKAFIHSQLVRNVEGACAKARRYGFVSKRIYFFLKTQEFRYHRFEIPLDIPLATPSDIMREINRHFDTVYKPDTLYRATGVTLSELIPMTHTSTSLFGEAVNASWSAIYDSLDVLERKLGTGYVMLAGSLGAHKDSVQKQQKTEKSHIFKNGLFRDIRYKKRLRIPYMGEARCA